MMTHLPSDASLCEALGRELWVVGDALLSLSAKVPTPQV